MRKALRSFWEDESGATFLEYGVILGLVGVVIIASMGPVKDELVRLLDYLRVSLDNA